MTKACVQVPEGSDRLTFEESFKKGKDDMVQGKYVDACSHFHKALECLVRKAAEAGPGAKASKKDLALEGTVRARLGHCNRLTGKFKESRMEFERAMAIAEEVKDDRLMAEANVGLGYIAWRGDDHTGARRHFSKAIELANRVHDKYLKGMAQMGLGNLFLVLRELDEGVKAYEEARSNLENVKEARTDYARLLHNLGFLYYKKGNTAKALELYKTTLSISDSIGDIHISGFTYENMALMYVSLDRMAEAEECIEKGGRLLARSNDRIGLNLVLWVRGLVKAKKGSPQDALELYRKAKRAFDEMGMATQVLHMTTDYIPVFKAADRRKEALDVLAELRKAFTKTGLTDILKRVDEAEKQLKL